MGFLKSTAGSPMLLKKSEPPVNCFPRHTWSTCKGSTIAASAVRRVGTLSVMSLSSRWVERSEGVCKVFRV